MEKLTAAAAREALENMVKLVTEENKIYQIEKWILVLPTYLELNRFQQTC